MFFILEALQKIADLDKAEEQEIITKATRLANEKISSFSEEELRSYAFDKLVDDYLKQLRRH